MIGETIVDASTTGSGNHITKLTFTGMKAITLSGESIRLELTKMSGPNLSMIVNGNDFDSQLSMPWSATGTYGAYPAAAVVPSDLALRAAERRGRCLAQKAQAPAHEPGALLIACKARTEVLLK